MPPPALINYYDVLNCHPSNTIDEIKKSYQALILLHHPDKTNTSNRNDVDRFYQIDEAWKVLRDPEQRKRYDAEMQQHKFDDEPIVYAKIYRHDFKFDVSKQNCIYPCRCGAFFALPEDCCTKPMNSDNNITNSANNLDFGNSCNDSTMKTCDECDVNEIYIECDECSFVVQLLSNTNQQY